MILICHTYGNKCEVCYPLLYVSYNFIPSPPQKSSWACTHPKNGSGNCCQIVIKKQAIKTLLDINMTQFGNRSKDVKVNSTNLLSLLLPVLLSTTVDFIMCGFARFIKYSHSSLDCFTIQNKSQHSILNSRLWCSYQY